MFAWAFVVVCYKKDGKEKRIPCFSFPLVYCYDWLFYCAALQPHITNNEEAYGRKNCTEKSIRHLSDCMAIIIATCGS